MLPTAKEKVESVFGAGRALLDGRDTTDSAQSGRRGGHGVGERDLVASGRKRRFEGGKRR
jgi:hypothetical protein